MGIEQEGQSETVARQRLTKARDLTRPGGGSASRLLQPAHCGVRVATEACEAMVKIKGWLVRVESARNHATGQGGGV